MAQWRYFNFDKVNSDVFRQRFQEEIVTLLDLDAIRPHLVQVGLLTEEERELLSEQSLSSRVRKQELTKILSQKGSGCVSKFLECLSREKSNSGHAQLLEAITNELSSALPDLSPDPKRMLLSGSYTYMY